MPPKIFNRHEGCRVNKSAGRPSGRFITFEGVEGSGKTSQLSRSAERLRDLGWPVIETREPGGTSVAEQIRDVMLNRGNEQLTPLTEAFLVMAARAQHVEEVIRPALAAGIVVLCDRFADSTLAYQGYGRGLDISSLRRLNRLATAGLEPDMTIVFDVPVTVGLQRRRAHREVNRLDMESVAFHERVRQGFLQLARRESRRVKVVNSGGSQAQISNLVLELIEQILQRPAPAHRRDRTGMRRSRVG
jgi:dTMP kinase